ncbi:MAG: glycoside hydrolase family 3 C-terminal domain-containing protein [Clostridia bacterium]|nr:glycoside hydrolase family 3 C-terminal domain-containing protein [Clostridia bacterium]
MKKITSVLLTVLLVFGAGVSALALSGRIDASVVENSVKAATDAEAEGIVLLKNDGGFLPLKGRKLNIFGTGSVYPFMGGAGSGAITSDDPVTFYDALDEEGIEYNAELRELYEKNIGTNQMPRTDNTVINNLLQVALSIKSLKEMPVSKLSGKIMENAAAYSDTALIMISRTNEEGSDLGYDTLRLNDEEKALIELVTGRFENVIVLFNIGNVMQMDWLEKYDNIRAAAIVWIPGEFGFISVARMLNGKVNPSGRLADTIAYNPEDHPSGKCFGSFSYADASGKHYVEYREGIYVGYRYFETFAKNKVQFPFGYGLSYTEFEKEVTSTSFDEEEIKTSVRVTNTGNTKGKETVQVYYSAPYKEGGIEKSAVCLGGFAKTDMLAPGESQTVDIVFRTYDMASYDSEKNEAWLLEAGDYKIIFAENAGEFIEAFTYTVSEDKIIKNDSKTGNEIKNLFDDCYNGFTVLSRADAQATYPEAESRTRTDAVKNADALPEPVRNGTAPKTGVKYDKTITLKDVYEDESLWDAFLDQLTLDEMALLVSDGGYGTAGIERLGIPATMDNDGPSSLKGRNGLLYTDSGVAFPSETAIACTWNVEIAYAIGEAFGKESVDMGTDILYAPAVNLHRNPRGGRNHEYFSEDPLISGKMAAAIINGCSSQGLVVTLKHFALYDQETHRTGLFVWANEQTMRELYLKAFEIALKESDCAGIMTTYSRVGADWSGGKSALLIDLLRTEWGFDGFVVSDFTSNITGSGYMGPLLAVYNGNDTMLTGIRGVFLPGHIAAVKSQYRKDPVGFGTALRERCKELCKGKMRTRAFLHPEITYDDSFAGALLKPSEWNFTFPYTVSAFRYLLNNITYTVIYALRLLFG